MDDTIRITVRQLRAERGNPFTGSRTQPRFNRKTMHRVITPSRHKVQNCTWLLKGRRAYYSPHPFRAAAPLREPCQPHSHWHTPPSPIPLRLLSQNSTGAILAY